MPSSFSRLAGTTRRRAVLIGAGALTIVAVGAGTTAAFAATPSASASTSTSASAKAARDYPSLRAIYRQLPGNLRADLKTLHKDSKTAKPAERKAIEQKALSGAYGGEIARVAHLFAGKSGASTKSVSLIPTSMKADLKTLRHDAKGSQARQDEFNTIWKNALGGKYGSTIETAAKAADTKWEQHHTQG